MRWSFATIVLVPRGTWAKPAEEAERRRIFDWAARAGFEGVELNPRWLDFQAWTTDELRALHSEASAHGLVFSGINVSRCILTRTNDAARHYTMVVRAIEAAPVLGAPVVTISLSMPTLPGPERPVLRGCEAPDEEFQESVELVRRLAEQAAHANTRLSLELHDDGLLDTPERCVEFLRRVDRANVGVNPDVGNICRGPGPLPDWRAAFAQLAPHANNWHVKNYRDTKPAPLGEGDIDYDVAFPIMRHAGYDGWVSIEGYSGDVLRSQLEGLDYLKQLAEREAAAARTHERELA